jgi:hypothetical protein
MNRTLAAAVLLVPLLAACPGEESVNPKRVWIALEGGSERRLQLVAFEPNPF